MFSTSQDIGRSAKGSAQIKSSNNRLQIVFSYAGKRHYLSLGLPDTPSNRRAALAKVKLIEADIAYERLDPTLAKYKPQTALSVTPITPTQPDLGELWAQFLEHKRPQCSPNTMYFMYGTFTGYLKRLPSHNLEDAPRIQAWVLKNIPLDSGKRFITRLSACCRWAVQAGLINSNPFDGLASSIKVPKAAKGEGLSDINPFSLEERDRIIEALETNQFCPEKSGYKHSFYAPLIKFLFTTGCRPSEAVALQWQHVSKDFRLITFEQVLINTESGRRVRQGLKTQERRRFPCNNALSSLLQAIYPKDAAINAWVFVSPNGKPVDLNNFRNRIWKPVLAGLGIEYRKLYQCRHTFITAALETGKLDAKDVAKLVGNSPEIIYRHYAGNKRELFVPEF